MENLFFASKPDETAAAQMARSWATARSMHAGARPLARAYWHASVMSVGEYDQIPDWLIDLALRMGSRVEVPAFTASFDRLMGFGGRYGPTIVLGSERPAPGFLMMRRAICAEMQLADMDAPRSVAYVPHVTLGFHKTRIPAAPVNIVTWTVHELVLIKSLLGRSKHICLGRWPLWVPAATPSPLVDFDGLRRI